ncbi:MAG: LCP family protein [Clostridia bacterium]|nr:LCP family protein [Clostridia bacterium]
MSKKQKKSSFVGKILRLVFALMVFTIIFISSVALYANVSEQHFVKADGSKEIVQGRKEYVTALVCGVNDKLTDMIMYMKYDTKNGKLFIMSIPRDTYVENEYCAGNKINAIYRGKYVIPLVEEVQKLLDTDIDYYVIFDTELVTKIVDEIGGVEVEVPFEMKYDDPTQDLHIDLEPGVQVLNGKDAEGFVRFRHNNDMSVAYAMGDLGRVKTQQEFVKAFVKSLLRPNNILKINKVVNIILEDTDTNVTMDDVFRYGLDVIKIDVDNIINKTAIGAPKYVNGISYFIMDTEKTQSEMESAF